MNFHILKWNNVDGHDLHYLIRKNIRLPYKIILAILHYVCEALDVLHNCEYMLYDVKRHGVVHRDIKPGNILISRKGEVKLADFGIAKPKDLTIHTTEMQVVGTVYYLSPEQIRREELDSSTDIYSLGCVMFEIVTGKKAFRHKNLMDVMEAKKCSNYDVEPLAIVPKAFQEIIHKCMSPDRTSRFINIKELQEEIDRLLKKEGVYNLKTLISDYVQDPETYTAIQKVKIKKAKHMTRVVPLVFLSIGTLFLLFALGFYSIVESNKRQNQVKVVKTEEMNMKVVETAPLKNIEEESDRSVSSGILAKKTKNVSVKQTIQLKPEVTKSTKKKKTTVEKISINEKVAEDSSNEEITGEINILSSFRSGKFEPILSRLDKFSSLNDTFQICMAGALVETGALEKASGFVNKINFNDGYLYYLKGRVAQGRGDFKQAISHYLSSLTKPTFNGDVRSRSNYQMALCREEVYKLQPNSVNKNSMMKSFDLYLKHYCKSSSKKECSVVRSLKNQYN